MMENIFFMLIITIMIIFFIVIFFMIKNVMDYPYSMYYQKHKKYSYNTDEGYYIKKANFKNFQEELRKALPIKQEKYYKASIPYYSSVRYINEQAIIDLNNYVFIFNKEVMIFNFRNFKKVYRYLEKIELDKPLLLCRGKWGK